MATEQPNADILLNYPPMILGATQPVFPDPAVPPGEPVVGLPLSLFRMAFNQQQGVLANAVEVAIDPPPHDGPNDDDISIEFIVNSKSMETRQIRPEDRDKRTKFDLFESELRDGSNNRVEYKVHHYSGNVGDSIPLWVLYRANLPGGNNVPGDDDHPYLDIRLPAELGNPAMIGKDEMDAGVPMTVSYPFMYDYDVIHYELRRERFTYTVQPGHTGNSVVITLTRAMFELAGNSANFEISYTVISNLNNATDKRRWSKTLTAEVDKDQRFLNKPILREVQSETGDNPAIIERGKLAGNPLLAVVVPTLPKFEVGDTVEGSYKATPSGTNQPFTGTIEEDGFGGFKPCIMYIPNDKVITNDDVVATYTLFRGGNVAGRSQNAEAHVIGEGAITLDPPTLAPPVTSPINVLDHDLGVTVRVTFAGNSGDQARLKELNPAPGAVPFPVQDIVGGRSDFNLSQTYLAVRQDSVIELTWELIRDGVSAGESAALRLGVNRMIDNDPRLPTPTITPADNGTTLDLNSFAGDTEAWIKAWRGIALWQPSWLWCNGRTSSGATVTLPIYQGVPIGSVGDQSGVVTRAFLDQLADGSPINVLAAVNFDGVANEATAVKFPVRTYTVRALILIRPEITSVMDSKGEIPPDGYTFDTSVTVSGKASPNQSVQLYDGVIAIDPVLQVEASGVWSRLITGLSVNEHNIKARALYSDEPESNIWPFTVTHPLQIVQTPMILDGLRVWYSFRGLTGVDAPGTTQVRVPTGGVPPYTYTSSDAYTTVNANGKVSAIGNGTSTITVTDFAKNKISFQVIASNKYALHQQMALGTFQQHEAWVRSNERYGYTGFNAAAQKAFLIENTSWAEAMGGADQGWLPLVSGCSGGQSPAVLRSSNTPVCLSSSNALMCLCISPFNIS